VDVGPVQELLSGWAFERVSSEIRSRADDAVSIVVAHACFRRRNVLYPGFPVACVKLLDPDMVITIVDDISNVRNRLKQHKTWSMWCEPTDLSYWREEEILVSLILAHFQAADYYVIPQAEPPITLHNLLYETNRKKIYLSTS
jgi:adenylate kinase